MTAQSPADWKSFTVTSGGCSCGFYHSVNDIPEDNLKLEKKYRKKGWSEAKIQRAIESGRPPSSRSTGLREDILALIVDITKTFGEIRLSLHWYSGNIETETFFLKDAGCVLLEDFKRDTSAFREETTILIKDRNS